MSNNKPVGWSLIHEAHAKRSIAAVHAVRNGGTGHVIAIDPEGFTLRPTTGSGDRHILWADVLSVTA
jgi:hypothetical protein